MPIPRTGSTRHDAPAVAADDIGPEENRLDTSPPDAVEVDEDGDDSLQVAGEMRAQLLRQYAIYYNGTDYFSGGCRYERLADAVAHARLMSRPPAPPDRRAYHRPPRVAIEPTPVERELMASLAITYVDGSYRHQGFRYDRLFDAVNYATCMRKLRAASFR